MEEKEKIDYFEGLREKKEFLAPDYSLGENNKSESDEDDDDDDDIDESCSDEDEGAEETKIEQITKEENKMYTPFGSSSGSTSAPTSSWGASGGLNWNKPWSGGSNNSSPWTQQPSSGWTGSAWGNNNIQKIELPRTKKIIFIDFLDCIVETWNSNGQPGLLPRDIYDLKPRFDVWQKLAAFNPEKIYAIIPINLIPNTNGIEGWQQTLGYFCCSLSAFLRVPYTSCQILAQSRVGQPKGEIMQSVINNCTAPKEIILSIGIYSGLNGQSNIDSVAANYCGIDHLDLIQLLNTY